MIGDWIRRASRGRGICIFLILLIMHPIANFSMRSRLFALIILFLFLGIPLILYWYFFHQNTSNLTIQTGEIWLEFHVRLEGKLQSDSLPLADKAFVFDRQCIGRCTLILPPLEYTLSLSASWREDIHDTIALRIGEKQTYSLQFHQKFSFTLIPPVRRDAVLESGLLENANASFGWIYRSIGTTAGWKYAALQTSDNKTTIGIVTLDRFITRITLPYEPQWAILDLSRQYIILDRWTSDRSILSLDGQQSIIFPYDETVLLVDTTTWWKVKTTYWVSIFEDGAWKKNRDYSDILDITPEFQIAYIDATDREKLSRGKFPTNESILLLIERRTGKWERLKSGLNIEGLLMYEGQAGFMDRDGNIGIFHLSGSSH